MEVSLGTEQFYRIRLILPSLTAEQVSTLLDKADNIRGKAIIALFTENGLRLSELINIEPKDGLKGLQDY